MHGSYRPLLGQPVREGLKERRPEMRRSAFLPIASTTSRYRMAAWLKGFGRRPFALRRQHSQSGEARGSRKSAFAGPMPALLAGPEMQAADCKGRFAGDLLDSLRALIFRRPNEGDFESVRVPDPPIKLILHTFPGRAEQERELFDNGRNGRWRAAMPRSRADTASQSGNSVIEQRRQRAEKRAYKERQAGPVSAQLPPPRPRVGKMSRTKLVLGIDLG